jgi:hypothetical protein
MWNNDIKQARNLASHVSHMLSARFPLPNRISRSARSTGKRYDYPAFKHFMKLFTKMQTAVTTSWSIVMFSFF